MNSTPNGGEIADRLAISDVIIQSPLPSISGTGTCYAR